MSVTVTAAAIDDRPQHDRAVDALVESVLEVVER